MIIGLVVLSLGMFAQSVEEAGEAYNAGNEAMKAKQYAGAVTAYENALDLAKAVGGEADELKGSIEKQLMNAYYKNGLTNYKGRKYDAAIANLEKSLVLSKEQGNTDMSNKTITYIAKVRSTKGNSLIKKGKLDEAFAEYEMGLEIKPNCVNAFYGKGLVYKEKGDLAKMMVNMDEAIKFGAENPKAAKTVAKAKKAASKALVNEAAREIQKEHGKEAIVYINDSFKYSAGNADTYYYLTIAYNKTKAYSKASESANTALGMKEGDTSDIYFELGQALSGSGNTSGACAAYKKVTTGPNVDAAKYQITEILKCG